MVHPPPRSENPSYAIFSANLGAARIFAEGGALVDVVSFSGWRSKEGGPGRGQALPQKIFTVFRLKMAHSSAFFMHVACNSRISSRQTEQNFLVF